MEKKDKGAAMIIAMLVLMFFMGISMNVFFIAEKKAKKSGVRVVGSKSQSVIDTGSNVGLYEVRTAFRYLRGYLNSSTQSLGTTQGGILFTAAGENVRPIRAGAAYIRTAAFHEYFNSYEVAPGAYPNPATTTDSTTPGSITPSAVSKVWLRSKTVTPTISLGGYEIDPAEPGTNYTTITDQDFDNGVEEFTTTSGAITTAMIKHLRTAAVGSTKSGYGGNAIEPMDFWIRYESTATLDDSTFNPGTKKVILQENVTDIIVRNTKN